MSVITFPSPFGREYEAAVLEEIPSDATVRYFPERGERPLLVRFTLPDGSCWVGGFGAGTLATRACSGVFADRRQLFLPVATTISAARYQVVHRLIA